MVMGLLYLSNNVLKRAVKKCEYSPGYIIAIYVSGNAKFSRLTVTVLKHMRTMYGPGKPVACRTVRLGHTLYRLYNGSCVYLINTDMVDTRNVRVHNTCDLAIVDKCLRGSGIDANAIALERGEARLFTPSWYTNITEAYISPNWLTDASIEPGVTYDTRSSISNIASALNLTSDSTARTSSLIEDYARMARENLENPNVARDNEAILSWV